TFDGIDIDNGANSNTIGGTAAGAGNLISGNGYSGIIISDPASPGGDIIQGNLIGTDAAGTSAIANSVGVEVWTVPGVTIGGASGANTIAFNTDDGVRIRNGATAISVLGNAIHSNGALGIDLVGGTEDGFGVTANDAGDGDTGANDLMNYPVIYSASISGGNVTVTGEARP
ncbi:MAG: Calx-beta domain-containing protein, partial [Burkholderiales bacterium]|nr:Calx-beta domain-containing protein [Burkholderiales bacterium]